MNIEGMTDEQKRIRIAETCGWKRAPEFDYVLASPIYRAGERMEMMCKDGDIRAIEELPDYLNDLNAMHAALKVQTQKVRAEFDRMLHAMAEKRHLLVTEFEAKDWADCFIRVCNLNAIAETKCHE